jgi:cytochrome c-type protein NapB
MRIERPIHDRLRWTALPVVLLLSLAACDARDAVPGDDAGRSATIALRPNRAYDGAPPVIPHLVGGLSRELCLNCHLVGDAVTASGAEMAPRTPHPELTNCRQCHVERLTKETFGATNPFAGHVWETGARQHAEAPWRIPHPLTLHENCLGCHGGENVPLAVRTTHPERTNCVQCHLPAHEGWPGPRPGVTLAAPLR